MHLYSVIDTERANLESAQGVERAALQEREQEITQQLSQTAQDIQARQQDLAADQVSQQLDLQEDQNVLAADQVNVQRDLAQNQQDLAVDQLNQAAVAQSNEQQLARRGQNVQRDLGLRSLFMGRSPLEQSLAVHNIDNTLQMNRTAAANNARFQRSGLEQQRFANEQATESPMGAVMSGLGAIGGSFLGGASGVLGRRAGGILGNKLFG